jgi:diaminopimelate dehydrogenase
MSKIRVAVVSYGNIGRFAVEAVDAAPDMELAGVVRRSAENNPPELANVKVVSDISDLGKVDVAILCSPTRKIPETAKKIMEKGICTVDSFDIHGEEMLKLRSLLDETGKKNNSKAIISAGWDPGSDSVFVHC